MLTAVNLYRALDILATDTALRDSRGRRAYTDSPSLTPAPPVAPSQAPLMSSATPSTPCPSLTEVKRVGPWSRILSASRFITSSEAPTYGARSICESP